MSQTTTQWILELVEKVTGPMWTVTLSSEKAANAVEDVGEEADESGKKLKSLSAIDLYAISDSVRTIAEEFDKLNAPGAEFNAQLKELEAITGVTGDALEEMGAKGRVTAKDFGGGLDVLGAYKGVLSRLGPDIAKNQEALDIMGRDIATLSKTMSNDAVGSMDALTTSMLQFGVDLSNPMKAAEEMTRMMNIMAAGAKEGASEVPQISAALKQAGVEALKSKVSFSETNTALQALAKGGKYGSEAGVALRNVLGKMAGIDVVPREAAAKLEQLGVDYSIVSDKTLPLTARLRELSKIQGDATLTTQIFGTENAAAAGILLRNIGYMDDLKDKITGTNTAVEQANIIMSGYNERMSRVKAWFNDIAIGLFDVTSKITPFVDGLASSVMVMANLANAKKGVVLLFDTLKTMPVIGKIVTWGSSLVTGAFGMMGTAAKALGVAIMNIPILGWIAAIVAALVALGAYFYKTSSTFRGFLWGVWDAVKTVFTGMWKFIKEVAQGVLHLLQRIFNPLNWFNKDYSFSEGFKKIADAAANYGKSIGESFSKGRKEGIENFYAANPDKRPDANPTTNPQTDPTSITPPSPVLSPRQLSPSGSTVSTGSGVKSGSGSSSGIKNISQKIDIKNYFSISGNADKNDFESIAERVVRAINEKLSDSIVVAS